MNSILPEKLKSQIVRSSEGDKGAFQELYTHLNDILFRYVLARVGNRSDALDILQEIFIDLWRALEKFSYRSHAQFYAFVFKITKRKLARHYDGRKIILGLDETLIDKKYDKEEKIKIDLDFLLGGIRRLGEKYKDVIELRYWSGLSFKEIALLTKTKETTVKVRHHRALRQLERILKKYER